VKLLRRRGARLVGAGLADQVVVALANAGNSLVALLLLPDTGRAGVLVLALAVGYAAVSLNRAFVGEVLLALAARFEPADRARLIRDGLAAALVTGLLTALVLVVVRLLASADLRDLGWIALVIPVVMLQDTARFSLLAQARQQQALLNDIGLVVVQAAAVVTLAVTHHVTAGGLVLCWGLGALAGYTGYVLRGGPLPWRGDPRRWPAQTRRLAGWFTATAVVGQVHTLLVTFLIGVGLSTGAVALFRLVQVTVLQPVQNFNQAVTSLLVPRLSKAAVMAKEQVNVQLRKIMTPLLVLAVALVLVGGLLAQVVFPLIPKYEDAAPLAWPVLLQAAIYLLQAPVLAALRGMHRGPLQFLQYVVFAVASVAGLAIGAATGELLTAAWGLVAGTLVGFATALLLYRRALRRDPAGRRAPRPVRRPKRRLPRPPTRQHTPA
jgi:O-antigen/teichoic acid export membrane protein